MQKAPAFSQLNEINAVVAADPSLIFKGGCRPGADIQSSFTASRFRLFAVVQGWSSDR
jgi:hypothetical protein